LLLRETWSRRECYSPVTQHAERVFNGTFVNVSTAGFRKHHDQGPWPIDHRFYNVFVFGGSTTFGYGVADDATVPAYLQQVMTSAMGRDVRVYNFGNSSFHSTQERARFEHLLMTDRIPDMAIFIDGLNEFGKALESDELHNVEAAYNAGSPPPMLVVLERLPVVRAGRAIKRRMRARVRRSTAAAAYLDRSDTTQTVRIVEAAIDRYLHNVHLCESAAAAYGVKTLFVWQPVPMYHYDLSRHPFAEGGFPANRFARAGYERFAGMVQRTSPSENFLWCADMQRDLEGTLYVDKIHYSPALNRLLAEEISRRIVGRAMIRSD